MPYRDEIEALTARVDALAAERDELAGRLERARAALASVVADMAALPPRADIPWRSLHGGEPIVVRFVNASARKLELLWVSYDGRERTELTLVPGGAHEHATFVAHLFRLVDPQTREVVLQRYVRADEAQVAFEE